MTGGGWRIVLRVPRRQADAVAAALEPHVEIVSVAFAAEPGDSSLIAAFGTRPPDTDAIRAAVRQVPGVPAAVDVTWLPALDWVAENRASFRPIRVGGFFIHDSDHAEAVPAAVIPLVIDATTAFGTGAHATTAGCLTALDRVARRRPAGPVLDIGCGTGVLGIAAARRLGRPVLATDSDPEAVRVAACNVQRNRVVRRVTVLRSDGYRDPRIARAGPYGLILANILARPLAAMAPALARHLRPGGRAVLSGMLQAQERQVLGPHLAQGLRLERRLVIAGWATLVLRRAGRVGDGR